jgi:biopolymer transport protein ExbB
MRTLLAGGLIVGLLAAPAPLAGAEETPAATPRAKSLDELLEMVRKGRLAESREHRAREQEFTQRKEDQQRLLRKAEAELAQEERRSEQLEKDFQANETGLAQLEEHLQDRLGALGELFGVVRLVAGDTRGIVEGSLVSGQLRGREAFLTELASSKVLPSMRALEQLWFTLQEEATESGKVVRFSAPVLTPRGEEARKDVIRVGVFNAVADGRYLSFLPGSGKLVELARQPAARHLSTVDDFEEGRDGLVPFAIDPSRGAILALLIQTPSFGERIAQGKLIGYIIIVLGTIGILLAIGQWLHLLLVDRKMRANPRADPGNPVGRVLAIYEAIPDADVETLERKLDEGILKEIPRLERFQTTIKVLSVVTPLLGLLGTVTGMIQTFQSITLFGTGDPKLMAGGISEALVTTMLGLCAAVPLVLLHSFVSNRSRAMVQVLDEQVAGMAASRAEEVELRGASA